MKTGGRVRDARWGARIAPWIVFAAMLGLGPAAQAHTITVDGSAADWTGVPALLFDTAQLSHDGAGHCEYVWLDAWRDTPAALGNVPGLDLVEFRITGDTQNLYFMALTRGTTTTSGAGAPMLQIAMRTDTSSLVRPSAFVDGARTRVASGAEWDVLYETRFATGAAPRVCDRSMHDISCAAQAAIRSAGVIEGAIPWTALGLPTAPLTPVRFSVALFRSSAVDTVSSLAPDVSNATDVVSDGGAPASTPNTTVSTAGGQLDYSFDLHFDRNGEPYAPLLVYQVSYAQGTALDWASLVNVSRVPLSLGDFKVGDASRPGSTNGGMGTLPAITLQPGHSIVVCQNADSFRTRYGFRAGGECAGVDPATPDLTPFAAWSESPGLQLNSNGDQVLVLDRGNTVIDVVAWKFAFWLGLTPSSGVTGQGVLQRGSLTLVTNDSGEDFVSVTNAVPGALPGAILAVGTPVAVGPDRAVLTPNPFHGTVGLSLRFPGAGPTPVSVQVFDVTGRLVRTVARDRLVTPGTQFTWSGDDDQGRALPSGTYLFRITAPSGTSVVRGVRLQ
ncbi:MAG TPA: FlgD immunoglobulin-like domain containing protein [Dongiaceae bacterium]|nr:FlgD immunoglobulin-like domain containing protein [Dongiaceae bacterium]